MVGCQLADQPANEKSSSSEANESEASELVLRFKLELDPLIYQDTSWADPPQMAIWLTGENGNSGRTIMVTHRTGAGDWEGKIECSVALPYWTSFYKKETGSPGAPTFNNPAPDAITRPTPTKDLTLDASVTAGEEVTYYLEVNASGDFNDNFAAMSPEGESDRYGNGQPSLVYRGTIQAVEGMKSKPKIFGHTPQHDEPVSIEEDLTDLTSATRLMKSIEVTVEKSI